MGPYELPPTVMADYNLYRMNDTLFWALLAIAVLFCVVHAARRAFRQPVPTD